MNQVGVWPVCLRVACVFVVIIGLHSGRGGRGPSNLPASPVSREPRRHPCQRAGGGGAYEEAARQHHGASKGQKINDFRRVETQVFVYCVLETASCVFTHVADMTLINKPNC